MKNLKKLLVLAMTMLLALGVLCACGKKDDDDNDSKKPNRQHERTADDDDDDVNISTPDVDDDIIPDVTVDDASANTLESYYSGANRAALDSQIETMKQQNASTISDISIDFIGNDAYFSYTLASNVTDEEWEIMAPSMESSLSSMGPSLIESIKSESGVTDEITITYMYYGLDGSFLGSFTIDESTSADDTTTTTSSGTTLEDTFSDADMKELEAQAEEYQRNNADTFSDVSIEVSGNTITYSYTFVGNLSDDEVELATPNWDASMPSIAESLVESGHSTGVTDPITCEVFLYNNNGKMIYSYSVTN